MIEVIKSRKNVVCINDFVITIDDYFGVEFRSGWRGYVQYICDDKVGVKNLSSFLKKGGVIDISITNCNACSYIGYLLEQGVRVFKFEKASEMMAWIEEVE